MKRLFVAIGLTLALLFTTATVTATPASAASLFQCQYKYYPFSVIWTTNASWVVHLTSTSAWFCVKWL